MAISGFNEQLRRIVLSGHVREDVAAQFLEQMTALEYIDHTKPITIYIDTYGGNIDAAMLMYDCMRTSACPINTVGIGKVMSAGTLLLSAGDSGFRYITPNTRVMVHEVSGGSVGTVSEMEASVSESKKVQDRFLSLLSKHTGKSKSLLLDDVLHQNNYMSAKEAIDYGLADKVFPSRKISGRKRVVVASGDDKKKPKKKPEMIKKKKIKKKAKKKTSKR